MTSSANSKIDTRKLTTLAILTAIVFVLQLLSVLLRPIFPIFTISLVLLPIVLGAALCGPLAGGWLGFIFAVAVFVTGDANAFLAINPFGTIVTVFAKGIIAGLFTGYIFDLLKNRNQYVAIIVSAILCPIYNTGVFLIGCLLFFMETITEWAGGTPVGTFMIVGLVGTNFLIELALNLFLSPILLRVLSIKRVR